MEEWLSKKESFLYINLFCQQDGTSEYLTHTEVRGKSVGVTSLLPTTC